MSIYGGPDIVTDGLVLHLDAADRNSYPGTGSTWYDLSGNGNNGTLTNGPTFSSANAGALVFDGVDDSIQTSSFTPMLTNKTLSGWVQLGSITQQGGGLINLQTNNGTTFDAIVYNETNQGWGFGSNGFVRTGWSGVKETSTTEWVYMAATYENLNYKMYRNGNLIFTLTSFNVLNYNFSSKSLIGYRHTGATANGLLNAKISQASIYNRALDESEILQNYNATKGRYGL